MFVFTRSLGWIWLTILIFALVVSSSGLSWLFERGAHFPGPTEVIAVVEERGFHIRLDGVTVSGDESIVPVGTSITARLIEKDIPGSVGDFSQPVGTGVEITLEGEVQPAAPITITYAPNEVAGWYDAAGTDDDRLPVVFASNDGPLGVEFADAQLQADGAVVVTTNHLSWFQPALASVSGFAGWMVDQMDIGMSAASEMPSCFDSQSDGAEWEFSEIPEQILWPCASETATGVEATLSLNATGVWLVSSDLAVPGYPTSLSFADMAVTAVFLQVIDRTTTSPLLPPGASVTFTASSADDEILFHAELSPPLTVINGVFSTLLSVTPAKKAEQLAQAQCVLDVIAEAASGVDAIDGSFVKTVVDCFASFVGGLTGTFLGAVTVGPTAIATMFDGIHRELTGRTSFSFTLSRIEEESTPSPTPTPAATTVASRWPTERNDSVTGLYIWLGANGFDFPDWVACDEARDYCLLGYNGEKHILLSGLDPVGTIDDTYADPMGALLYLGVPEESAEQILND